MITKEQAMAACHGDDIHAGECKRTVGKRGGVKESIEHWRVNGECKTWKRQPGRFHLPVKRGLRDFHYIDETNQHRVHFADDCPLVGSENMRLVKRMVRETKATIERMKEGGETVE